MTTPPSSCSSQHSRHPATFQTSSRTSQRLSRPARSGPLRGGRRPRAESPRNRARGTRSPLRSTATVRGSRPSPATRSAGSTPAGNRCGSPLRTTTTRPRCCQAADRSQQVLELGPADGADGGDDQRRGAAAELRGCRSSAAGGRCSSVRPVARTRGSATVEIMRTETWAPTIGWPLLLELARRMRVARAAERQVALLLEHQHELLLVGLVGQVLEDDLVERALRRRGRPGAAAPAGRLGRGGGWRSRDGLAGSAMAARGTVPGSARPERGGRAARNRRAGPATAGVSSFWCWPVWRLGDQGGELGVELAVPDRRDHGPVLVVHEGDDVLLLLALGEQLGVARPLARQHLPAHVDEALDERVARSPCPRSGRGRPPRCGGRRCCSR